MKKIIVALMLLAMITVTGCGKSNTLTCTKEEDGTVGKAVLTYKKDKLTKISLTTNTDISGESYSDDDLKTMEGMYGLMCSAFSGEGMTCDTKVTKEKASLSISLNLEKASADTLKDLEMDGLDSYSKETAKKELTEDGYTCK